MIFGIDVKILTVVTSISGGEVIKELVILSFIAISAPPTREHLSLQQMV